MIIINDHGHWVLLKEGDDHWSNWSIIKNGHQLLMLKKVLIEREV